MSVGVAWARGGEARIVSLSADAIALASTAPWPPGSRIEGTLTAEGLAPAGGSPPVLRVKVHASRRTPEGDFLVEGRPIDLGRGLRERLEALLARG
ncbi:MAG TPA: hypothetical protein VGM06_22710 [Polyangiaceae bacterium]|jgi:hypothetical protein